MKFSRAHGGHIYLPRHLEAESTATMQVQGHYKLTIRGPRGARVAAEFPNLILNAGLDRMGNGVAWLTNCQVGSGSTAPDPAQTGLVSFIAAAAASPAPTNVDSYVPGPPPYHQLVRTYRFPDGTAAGNLSEVGVGWATSGSLYSRALILDGSGNPTTITVLSDETLDVQYTLRIYPPTTDHETTLNIAGDNYTVVTRSCLVGTAWRLSSLIAGALSPRAAGTGTHLAYGSGSTLGAITSRPSGSGLQASGVTTPSYTNGSYFREAVTSYGLSTNPSGGIKCVETVWGAQSVTGNAIVSQTSFDPIIPKDNEKIFTFTTRLSWARRP